MDWNRIILTLGIILIAFEAFANPPVYRTQRRKPEPYIPPIPACDGPQPTPLVHEGFEGTGFEESGWTTSADGVNEDSVEFISQAQSLRIDGTLGLRVCYRSDTPAGEYWVYFAWKIQSGLPTTADSIYLWQTAGFSTLGGLVARADGTWTLSHGSTTATGGSYTYDTTYHIWLHYLKGTGADGVADLYVLTDDGSGYAKKPVSPTLSITTGTSTGDAAVQWHQCNANINRATVVDNHILDNEEIGSDPFICP